MTRVGHMLPRQATIPLATVPFSCLGLQRRSSPRGTCRAPPRKAFPAAPRGHHPNFQDRPPIPPSWSTGTRWRQEIPTLPRNGQPLAQIVEVIDASIWISQPPPVDGQSRARRNVRFVKLHGSPVHLLGEGGQPMAGSPALATGGQTGKDALRPAAHSLRRDRGAIIFLFRVSVPGRTGGARSSEHQDEGGQDELRHLPTRARGLSP